MKSLQFNDVAVRFRLDLAHGNAADGEFVRNVKGTMIRPSIRLERSAAKSKFSADIGYASFAGDAEIVGKSYRLKAEDAEAMLLWEFEL